MGLQHKFKELKINYDEIVTYDSQHSQLEHLAQTICASSAIVNKQDIVPVKNMFLDAFEQLNIILIKYIPGKPDVKWCTLPSLLHCWGVALPPHLLDAISQFIVFPEEKKVLDLLDNHPIPNTSGNFQPGHNISLKLAKCLTLCDLLDLVKKLNDFQQPIMDVLDMLVFFKLHHSGVFDKYLQVHLRKESEPVTKAKCSTTTHLITVSTFPPFSMQHQSDDQSQMEGLSLHALQRAMTETHELIMKLMHGTAEYSEIIAEGEIDFEKLDMEQEFNTLYNFSAHFNLPSMGLSGVQSMLELFQYVHHIRTIYSVCEQYQLQGCLSDPNLCELHQLAEYLSQEKNCAKLKLSEAPEKMKKVKKTLFPGNKVSLNCLELFTVVRNSAAFYQFIRDMKFVEEGGQALFQQQYQLITAQLQHEEYDETVLNDLYGAFKLIEPFMDAHQNFNQLMSKVTSLDVSGLNQLKTVNTNITLIRLWFSRAEVRWGSMVNYYQSCCNCNLQL